RVSSTNLTGFVKKSNGSVKTPPPSTIGLTSRPRPPQIRTPIVTTATRTHAPVEPIGDLTPRRRPRGMVARRTRAVAIKTNSLSAAVHTLHHEVDNHLRICRTTPSHDARACYGNLIAQRVYLCRCADCATTAAERRDHTN